MNARKGWFLGIALVVITMLSLGWFILIQPPFRFLRGMRQTSYFEWPGSPTVIEHYHSNRAYQEVVGEAKNELLKLGYSVDISGDTFLDMRATDSVVLIDRKTSEVHVYIEHPVGNLDHLRLRFFRK